MEDGRPRPSSTALHQSGRKEVLEALTHRSADAGLEALIRPAGNNAASFFRILPYNYLANVSPKSCASRN